MAKAREAEDFAIPLGNDIAGLIGGQDALPLGGTRLDGESCKPVAVEYVVVCGPPRMDVHARDGVGVSGAGSCDDHDA